MRMFNFITAAVLCCAFATAAWAGSAAMSDSISVVEEASDVETTLSLLFVSDAATLTAEQWTEYSEVLGGALDSEVEGLRYAALRLAIQYSDDLTLDRSAIHDMAAMYRNHRNDNVRRMAVVALASTDDSWAIDYLKRSVAFEKTPKVLHTLKAVLQPEIIVGEPEPVVTR